MERVEVGRRCRLRHERCHAEQIAHDSGDDRGTPAICCPCRNIAIPGRRRAYGNSQQHCRPQIRLPGGFPACSPSPSLPATGFIVLRALICRSARCRHWPTRLVFNDPAIIWSWHRVQRTRRDAVRGCSHTGWKVRTHPGTENAARHRRNGTTAHPL